MDWIGENSQQTFENLIPVRWQKIPQPVKRLNYPHRGMTCPIQAAWGGVLKFYGQISQLDRLKPGIREYRRVGRHCVGQAQVVGGGDSIDDHTDTIAA
jgi:hypothetical protein